jgi:hypothetical protein
MATISVALERHHRLFIGGLTCIILFFLFACTFHEVIPICHYLFGCDHGVHLTA